MTTCAEVEPLLGASLDAELDPQTALRVERHISICAACSAQLTRLERLRIEIAGAGLDWSEQADLSHLKRSIRRRQREPFWRSPWLWPAVAAAAALGVVLLVLIALPRRPAESIDALLADNHVRSLQAAHLVDVPSSDQHTVKPWFQGKLDFSPQVQDLTGQGFTLLGGRLDVVAGRPAAAIVYQRRKHVINLWIAPDTAGSVRDHETTTRQGFHIVHWTSGGFSYWAVSDLNLDELRQFAALIRRP